MLSKLFQCYNITHCDSLDNALTNFNLIDVKAIARKLNIPYHNILYDKNLDCDKKLEKAINFTSLEDCKYVLQLCGKIYPQDLYSTFNLKDQLTLANILYDFEGLKYICASHQIDHKVIYREFTKKEALKHAIMLGDYSTAAEQISNIIEAYHPTSEDQKHLQQSLSKLKQYYQYILDLSYRKEALEIVEIIIPAHMQLVVFWEYYTKNNWDKHNIGYLVKTDVVKPMDDYLKHIKQLTKLLSWPEHISSYFITLTHAIHNSVDISLENNFITLEEHIYTKDVNISNELEKFYTNITLSQNRYIKDILRFIEMNHFHGISIHIIIPETGKTAFFSPAILSDSYREHVIYLPTDSLKSPTTLLHELTHFFFALLFENQAAACSSNLMCEEHEKMVNEIIKKVISKATNNLTIDYDNYAKSRMILNEWYNDSRNIKLTNYLCKKFNCADYETIAQKEEFLINIYHKLNYTKDFSFVLNRIYDYLKEPQDRKLAEFFSRFIEFQFLGMEPETLELLAPAYKYWDKYINTTIEYNITKHFIDCKEHFRSNRYNECGIEYLNYNQQVELLRETVLSNNYNAIYYLYTQKEFIQNISHENKKAILKEHIRDCVKLCNSENECEYFWGNFFYWIKGIFSCKTIIYSENTQYSSEYEQMASLIYQDLTDNII